MRAGLPGAAQANFKPNFLRNEAAVGSTNDDLRGTILSSGSGESELPMFGEMVK